MIGRLLRFVREASRLGLDPLGLGGLLEATPNFIGVAIGERLAYVNGASQRLLGVASQDELLGHSVYDFVHPDDRERARSAMQQARSAGSPVPFFEVRLVRADGMVLDVEVWLAPIRMRGEDAVLIHGRDHSRRRSAERAMQESEALYRRLAENSSDMISEYDAEWRLVYVSPSIERILGYPQNTWVGRRAHESFGEMTHPDDLAQIFSLETTMGGSPGSATEFTHRARKTDGSWCWLHSRGRRYLANGEMRTVVVSRDVTEEHRVLEALRESERSFQTLARAVPVGIFKIDSRGRHTYLNERWAELTGISIEEALANPAARPLHPEDEGAIFEIAQRALAEGRTLQLEQRIVRPDGQIRWVLMQAVAELGPRGEFEGWVGTLTDLSEKRSSQQALAESEERLRLALEGANVCTWQWDSAVGVVEWSANATRVYGLAPGQALPTTTREAVDLVHPEDVAFARELAYRQIARGEAFELEFRLAPREGEGTRWILMRGHLVPESGRAIGIAADVTARRQLAQERADLEARLHESQHLESLGLLAGGVAHDFNNLLVGILGNIELALQRPSTDPGLRECLEEIRRSGDRAAALVRQVLAFAGRERIARERIDLREIVEDTLDALRHSLPARAKLDWFAPAEPVWVDGDATQLRQVLMNLITNACEALPREGGQVLLRLLRAGEASEADSARGVEIEVRDTGCGVDPGALGRIFDPFFTTKGAGRGLGLAVAHGIVRAHGGEVAVESAPGRGTCMRVRLPAVAPDFAPSGAPAKPGEDVSARAEGTILVVDDERGVREIARRALEGAGYTVLLAGDRSEALARAGAHSGELRAVLLDLTLGNESGETLLAALRELGCAAPVFATSGYAPDHALRRLQAHGVTGFVQKPFTGSSLVRTVGELLSPRAS